MFLFGKRPVNLQQDKILGNKEDRSPEEMKTYLLRKYQYKHVMQQSTSTYQPFNQMSDTTTKREFTRFDQNPPKSGNKWFEGKCFHCRKHPEPQEARIQRTPTKRRKQHIRARGHINRKATENHNRKQVGLATALNKTKVVLRPEKE